MKLMNLTELGKKKSLFEKQENIKRHVCKNSVSWFSCLLLLSRVFTWIECHNIQCCLAVNACPTCFDIIVLSLLFGFMYTVNLPQTAVICHYNGYHPITSVELRLTHNFVFCYFMTLLLAQTAKSFIWGGTVTICLQSTTELIFILPMAI